MLLAKKTALGRVALAAAMCGHLGKLLFDGQRWAVSYCSSEVSRVEAGLAPACGMGMFAVSLQ